MKLTQWGCNGLPDKRRKQLRQVPHGVQLQQQQQQHVQQKQQFVSSTTSATTAQDLSDASYDSSTGQSEVDTEFVPQGDENLPWRRSRSLSRGPPTSVAPWRRASQDRRTSRDRSLSIDKREEVKPWTAEVVKLKKTAKERKTVEKEKLETVQLKPTQIQKPQVKREQLEKVELKTVKREQQEISEHTMEEMVEAIISEKEDQVDYHVQKLRHDEDMSILEIQQQVDELVHKDSEKAAGVPWLRGGPRKEQPQFGKEQFVETDESTLLKVDRDETTIEQEQQKLIIDQGAGVAWRRGKRPEPERQPFAQVEDSTMLSVDRSEDLREETQPTEQPQAVPWRRGPKVAATHPIEISEREDTALLKVEQIEQELQQDMKPNEQPVAWRRGPKPAPEEQQPTVEEQPETQLPPWMRGRKPGPKRELPKPAEPEKVEQVMLKPTPRQKKELPKESVEEVSLKPVPKKPVVEELIPAELEEAEEKTVKIVKKKKPKPTPELESLEKLEFTPTEVPEAEKEELPEKLEQEVEPKQTEEPTIKPKPIPEHEDKPEPEHELEMPSAPEEDTSLPPWRRGRKSVPKREIPAAEPVAMETVTLKPTPKRAKELPQESLEKVSLKPVPQRSEVEDVPADSVEFAEVKDITPKKTKKPKRKEDVEPLEKPVYPEIPEAEPIQLEMVELAPEEVPIEPEAAPVQPPWRRTPKPKPVETEPEEKKWPTGKRRPPVEEPTEEVLLKPIPKPTKEAVPEPEQKVTITPKKPEPVPSEETPEVTPWRRIKKEKPLPEEEEPKEWPKGKRRPLPETPQEEIVLKPIPKPTPEESPKPSEEPTIVQPAPEPEQPKPTPWRRGKKDLPKEETPKEEVTLKPIPKRTEPDQTVQEEVILKPVPAQLAVVEEIPAPHELQPVRDVQVEEVVTKKIKRIKKQIIRPKYPESGIAEVEESVTFEEREEPAQVAETIVDIVPEEVLDLIPEQAPREVAKKRKSRNKKHVVFKEELSTFAMEPEDEEVEDDEEEEQVQEISRSSITLTRQVPESKPIPAPSEELKHEEQTAEFRKEMEVRIQSNVVKREKQRRVFIDDSQPLPELEIITQKRIQEVTDKVAEEDVREERKLIEMTQQRIAETKIQERTVKIVKPNVQPPSIVEKLQPQICEPDKPVQLRCRIEGVPFPAVQWYFNDTLLFANSEYIMNVVEDVATLEIATVQPYHVGIYTCEAKNVAGVALSKANIVVQEKLEYGEAPRFVVPLRIELNEPKTVATITCQVAGVPTPKVRWLRDEIEIIEEEEEEIETYYEERTGHVRLTVKRPQQNVPVVYTVVAENKLGKAVGKANLYIQSVVLERAKPSAVAPQIVQPLEAQVVRTGSTLVFECRFTGLPKPTVKWFRNSKEVVEEQEEVIVTTEEYFSRLEVRRVTRQRGGKYEVTVTNEAGQAKSSASVAISDATDTDEAKAPRFIEPLVPKLIAEAEVCILEASVDSYPTSTFQWFKEGAAVTSTNEQRIVTTDNRSILIIESFTRGDTGAYTCRAENVAGSVTSTATVQTLDTIETEEVTEYISPRFLATIKPTRVMDGERLTLECQVVAMPLPKVHWYHNAQLIRETKDKQVQQDSTGRCLLTISEVFPEDTGEYTCVATNRIGEAVCRATVNVEPFEYVPDSEQFRSSEEDLLTDKSISTLEEYAEPIEYAPQIVKQLPTTVHSQERELTKLEVKVRAQPRPQVRWLKAGEEIVPSEEFQIENFDDGTSILIINDIYPDDSGEITFEAHNALGVAITTTELVVEEIVGTKAYRKPEWVQHMEDLKEALKASYSTPSYSVEIKDSRAMLGEKGFFECHYAGNPKPDILWYRNGKIVIANERIKIRTNDTSSTLTIYPVEVPDFGFYKCKAMNEAGTAESISKLIESLVPTLTDDEKALLDATRSPKRGSRAGIKNGKAIDKIELVVEESEEVRREKAEKRKKREEKRKEKESLLIDEIVKQEMEASLQEKIKFSSESTTTLTTSTTSEMTQDVKLSKDRATVKFKEHVETLVEEIVTTETVQEIERMVIHEKLDVSDVEGVKNSVEVKEILTNLKAGEFGPGEAPLRELATIAFMVKHGVTVSEITSFYQANHFPALQKPESQSAMVLLLEREGYANIVTEILTETDMDETQLAATAGFRAFMRMIEVNHASVEEIIAHFSPDDFVVQEWKTETAYEVR
uniref:Ig-like domain-containing protein n=1 Tax=Anopheles dirus TaxID=7168 RepID=A0A182NH79_9DIPT